MTTTPATVTPSMSSPTPGPITVPSLPSQPIGSPVVTVPAPAPSSTGTLPFTGADFVQIAVLGLALLAASVLLRWRRRAA